MRLLTVWRQFKLEGLQTNHTVIIYSPALRANTFRLTKDGCAVRALDPALKDGACRAPGQSQTSGVHTMFGIKVESVPTES